MNFWQSCITISFKESGRMNRCTENRNTNYVTVLHTEFEQYPTQSDRVWVDYGPGADKLTRTWPATFKTHLNF